MEKQYFSLQLSENNKLTKIVRILFGIVCMAVAVFWMIYNIKLLKADGTLWITIIFLSGFGIYQIFWGLGYTIKFIEISPDYIRLKKNAILPVVHMPVGELEKIEFLTLNVIFFLKSKRRVHLRFGTTYHETNEKIVNAIIGFAEANNIPSEITDEEL